MAKSTLNLRIDERLKKEFQKKLDENHETATEVITRAIEAYCNDTANSNDIERNASNAVEDERVTPDDENETQQEIEKLKAEMEGLQQQLEMMQGKVSQQFKVIDEDKLDRAIFNGWAVPYPLEIDPQPAANQIEDKPHQQPQEKPIQAEIGTELAQKDLAKRMDAQAKILKREKPDDDSLKDKVSEQDIGYYLCEPFDPDKPKAQTRDYIGFCKKYDPDGFFWEWNGKKRKSKRFTAKLISDT